MALGAIKESSPKLEVDVEGKLGALSWYSGTYKALKDK